jgi:hypothetical protein
MRRGTKKFVFKKGVPNVQKYKKARIKSVAKNKNQKCIKKYQKYQKCDPFVCMDK